MPCFKPPDLGPHRVVYANQKVPSGDDQVTFQQLEKHYADNVVKTYKYEIWNFPAKNLFEQFRRIANFYFLCIVIVQFALGKRNPVSPMTSLLPLLFVIFVTAVKQGYEDWLRHKADREVNNRKVFVIKDGQEVEVFSKDIRVGDIVKVLNGDEFPCDMVVISTSDDDGSQCSIMTANLDGETNLKTRNSLQETASRRTVEQLASLQACVECDHPEYDMYKFNGRMVIGSNTAEPRPLDPNHLLLRGAKLMNTAHAYGLAVYTGKETKMALNQQSKVSKFSQVERAMNKFLVVFLILLLIQTCACLALKISWEKSEEGKAWYMLKHYDVNFEEVMVDFLSFLILFNYVIPISLYVTIELQKFCGARFFSWDLQLYHYESDEPAKANTSDLVEELGQIEYVFSDKTGTLTENDMQFRQCSIGGIKFEEKCNKLFPVGQDGNGFDCSNLPSSLKEFFIALSLCHTAQASELAPGEDVPDGFLLSTAVYNSKIYKYQASSPDEKALCEAAARYGVIFRGKVGDCMELEVEGKILSYKLLHVLEFDATRKRMSVIVESPDQEILMLCKGADSHVAPRVASGPTDDTLNHIEEYAEDGLRTLTVASRTLSKDEFNEMNDILLNAQRAIGDREEMLEKAFDQIENNFHLLGATAVEDKLQEGVKETIESLREAGIKVWVLTGDKQETAVNISHSCAHFSRGMDVMYLTQKENKLQVEHALEEYLKKLKDASNYCVDSGLVVDGGTLLFIDDFKEQFLELASYCSAVLCCRMSPLQKAQIVRCVKEHKSRPVTLAIGDGANDCSMIQEAHVGCGIMGKEGRQAVRCSDYAFHRFRYLKRVLLVHGHNYYTRLATVVQYFFYKNVAFITPQFLYQIFNGFSGEPLYSSVFLTSYNIFFTSMPILFYGIFEQDVSEESLMEHPSLYKDMSKNEKLSWKKFLCWVLAGVWHALVMFYGVASIYNDTTFTESMNDFGLFSFGTFVFTLVVIVTNLKLASMQHYWTWFVHFFLWGGIILYFLTLVVISNFIWPWPGIKDTFELSYDFDLYYIFFMLAQSSGFWFGVLGLTLLSLLPDIIITVFLKHVWPTETQTCQINDSDVRESLQNNKVGEVMETEAISMSSVNGTFENDDVKLISARKTNGSSVV